MSKSISLFDDHIEYLRHSGLSRDGREVVEGGNPFYVARQGAVDVYRKMWSHECQFVAKIDNDRNDQDPESQTYAEEGFEGFNSASCTPNQEEIYSFNETVDRVLSVVGDDENMVKLLFVKIRRLDLEHYLREDTLQRCLEACGEHAPTTDFEEAKAVGFADTMRGKSHSNQRSRTLWAMQDKLKAAHVVP